MTNLLLAARSPARFIAFAIALLIAAPMLALSGVLAVNAQTGDALTLERSISPTGPQPLQTEYTVTLTLKGNSALCAVRQGNAPTDIVLVMDRSGSMEGDKIAALKTAAIDFVSRATLTRDQIALVGFDDAAIVAQGFTADRSLMASAINALSANGGTRIDQGIEVAMRELSGSRARPAANRVIVLLSDGRQADTTPKAKAIDARQRGIRLITIGLGGDADQGLLRDLASQPTDFHYAPGPDQLAEVYRAVGISINRVAPATGVSVEHDFDATALELIPDSITPKATLNGNRLTWTVPSVSDAPVELTYRARARGAGSFSADRGDVVRYVQCGEKTQELKVGASLTAIIVPPTPPPGTTPTAIGSGPLPAGSAPGGKATAEPGAPLPGAVAQPRPPGAVQTPVPVPLPGGLLGPVLCDLNWVPVAVGIVALILIVWWVLRWLTLLRQRRTDDPLVASQGFPCDHLLKLFWPLSVLLLGAVLSAIGPAICPLESVYFWRISPGAVNGRLFVTDQYGLRQAAEFAAISPGQCVGCHTVSSSARLIAGIPGAGVGDIALYRLNGAKVEIPATSGSFVSISPDGTRLAVGNADLDIVIVNLQTRQVTKLLGASDPNVAETMPAWSADGTTIAFARGTRTANSYTFSSPVDIFTVPAVGGTARPLPGASGEGYNYYPAYSPDGKWLAFTRHTRGVTSYAAAEAEIFVVPAAGGERTRLRANDDDTGAPLSGVSNSWPTWSLDGKKIAFTSKRADPSYDIYIADIDGNGNSSAPSKLQNAAIPGVFEHTPYWGEPPAVDLGVALLGILPWLLPFLLVLLAWWLCRHFSPRTDPLPIPETSRVAPGPLPAILPQPTWQIAPTLIVGIGGTGRWVLTHLKKALRDGGGGQIPDGARFLLLDTSERENTNRMLDEMGLPAAVSFAGVELDPSEMVLIGGNLGPQIESDPQTAQKDVALWGWFPYDEYRTQLGAEQRNLSASTFGRRPMARAGLINHLRPGSVPVGELKPAFGQVGLWDRLVEGCQHVHESGAPVRVVVVGSLAGGMSGVINDVAFLARAAAKSVLPSDGTSIVEAYLATPSTFIGKAEDLNPTRLKVNTFAAARELERMQLAEGLSTPMGYGVPAPSAAAGPAHEHSKQSTCNWMLFDNVCLFGGESRGMQGPEKSSKPWASTYASMADVIGLRLDAATRAGTAGDYHAGLRNDILTRQAQEGRAVVSGAGSFSYRLPVMDIVEIVAAQWARKLFHVFITDGEELTSASFDWSSAGLGNDPSAMARSFLSGQIGVDSRPVGMACIGDLAGGQVSALRALPLAESAAGSGYGRSYLDGVLDLILNGRLADGAPRKRAPRLGFAIAFLGHVSAGLEQAEKLATAQRDHAPSTEQRRTDMQRWMLRGGIGGLSCAEWEVIVEQIRGLAACVRDRADGLALTQKALLGDAGAAFGPAAGLLDILEARQARAEIRRQQMDHVSARKYLWQVPLAAGDAGAHNARADLVKETFRRAEEKLPDLLDRLHWESDSGGGMRLSVIVDRELPIVLDPAKPQSKLQIADELGRLGFYVARESFGQIDLSRALAAELTGEQGRELAFVERTWQWAEPGLKFARNVNHDIDGDRLAAAGWPQVARGTPELKAAVDALAATGTRGNKIQARFDPCLTSMISTTDRLGVTLVREYAKMPLMKLPELLDAREAYRRNAGREAEPQQSPSRLAHVFSAERSALEYEARLNSPEPLLHLDFRTFSPLVVLGLSNDQLAEQYACAYAAGWVTRDGDTVLVSVPGASSIRLELRDRVAGIGTMDWEVAGLLAYSLGGPSEALSTALVAAIDDPTEATLAKWRAHVISYRGVSAAPAGKAGDVSAMAALAVFRRLVPPEQRETLWKNLIMLRPI